jgi:hypothetical protein
VRSAGTTERSGWLSDLIASRIERSRGQDWRYGDCGGSEAVKRFANDGCQQRATPWRDRGMVAAASLGR